MSTKNATDWLESQNSFTPRPKKPPNSKLTDRRAVTISVTSGKGGVGKTSTALKSARIFSDWGFKVLLIDCDYNLSNTSVKLGIPLNNNFQDYLSSKKEFESCLYKHGQFHLFSGCNGNFELFENKLELEKIIIDILVGKEADYDFIILDSPAGLLKETLVLNAYCDYRFVVVTPDKSSITDSYSLMKILSGKFGVKRNHLLVNKVSTEKQFARITRSLTETVDKYLNCRLQVLGGVKKLDDAVDLFDQLLLNDENSDMHKNFVKILNRFVEETLGPSVPGSTTALNRYVRVGDFGQDVQTNVC